jgi:hypothetical protein
VFALSSSVACPGNADAARSNRSVANRQNLTAGESFNDPYTVSAESGRSYRFCGYLGDFNQNQSAPPDARAELVVCAAGTELQNNACVTPGGGGTDGGGTSGVPVDPDSDGECANVGRFSSIVVLRVNCADAQRVERAWARRRGCKPSRSRPRTSCTVLGLRCRATRSSRTGNSSVRCSRSSTRQVVRFRYRA